MEILNCRKLTFLLFILTFIAYGDCAVDYATYNDVDEGPPKGLAQKALLTTSLALAMGTTGAFNPRDVHVARQPQHFPKPYSVPHRPGWVLHPNDQNVVLPIHSSTALQTYGDGVYVDSVKGTLKKTNRFTNIMGYFLGDMCMYSVLTQLSTKHSSQFGSYGFIDLKDWTHHHRLYMRPYVDRDDWETSWAPFEQHMAVPHTAFVYGRPLFDDARVIKYKFDIDEHSFMSAPELSKYTLEDTHVRQLAAIALVDMLVQNTDRLAWPGCGKLHAAFGGINTGLMWYKHDDSAHIELLPIDNSYNFQHLHFGHQYQGVPSLKMSQYCNDLDGWSLEFLTLNKHLFASMDNGETVCSAENVKLFSDVWRNYGVTIANTVLKVSNKYGARRLASKMNGYVDTDLFRMGVFDKVNAFEFRDAKIMTATVKDNVQNFKRSIAKKDLKWFLPPF